MPRGGDTLHGYFLPEGTEVGQCMVGIGRQPEVWDADADVFRPERWFEVSPDKLQAMQMASDIVFSSGKCLCLGKSVAWMELIELLCRGTLRFLIDFGAHYVHYYYI